ncbi:WbuC family cupin fold metalloprotein [Malikia granosa]|uniref:Cupin fold metalloprotein, WbuC family n=1 Tax=Malikia granosa TaxID=263067 RepID=A0A2S9K6H1_9BURK|nr:WbuC family cupin fold metalloprotein [Malikia granosa]PRD66028.1 cupin fold metalloprotein, WbuC family [Malikia granosa]
MKIFCAKYLDELSTQAKINPRQRQHRNIHYNYQESCQRLFNAIEPDSYIRPHRHSIDPKDELLITIRGEIGLLIFNNNGDIIQALRFGSEKYGSGMAAGFEIPANTWHTVIALRSNCILLEIKSGPFDPNNPKELAPWAPEEGSTFAVNYLNQLAQKFLL